MSSGGSSNAWISFGVGVLAAAAVLFTGGTALWAVTAFSLASTGAGLLLGPNAPKGNGKLRPDEMQVNQSAEDSTVPVIQGRSRVAANFIFVDIEGLTSQAIKDKQSGGKGGGSKKQVVGFRYFVPIHYGICMGEIDLLHSVVGSPGMEIGFTVEPGLSFTDGDPEEIVVEWVSPDGANREGGAGLIYPGSDTQGDETDSPNYRGVCWIAFESYEMTNTTSPKSMLFEIERMPKVLDDSDATIEGFSVRASSDSELSEYRDANPAAVAWEILRNSKWGKGMRASLMNVDDFKAASLWYEANRIGLSTAMGRQSVTEFMRMLREIFGLWIWWDGSQMRCRCIYDPATAYSPKVRIGADDIMGAPNVTRSSLAPTYNEIRLEFTNREDNWQSTVATVMDLAHIQTTGGIRTQTIDAPEIGTRRAAELIANELLRQMAYPGASCSVKLHRSYSGLQPGSFVELQWDEWREEGMATSYWRVIDITDDDQGSNGIDVLMIEDLYASAVDGVVDDFTAPTPSISSDSPLDNSDLSDGSLVDSRPPGSLEPIVLFEPNSWISGMNRRIVIAPTREFSYVQTASVAFRLLGESETTALDAVDSFPLNGELVAPLGTGQALNRYEEDWFQIQLFYASDGVKFEAATGIIQDDADHFADLSKTTEAILIIGTEVFRVGLAEEEDPIGSPGLITVKTYMRGELGTVRQAHSADDIAVFYPEFTTFNLIDASEISLSDTVEITAVPNKISTTVDPETYVAPDDGLGIVFSGTSIKPFAPGLITAERAGLTWTVRIRPRVWLAGAGSKSTITDDANALVTTLEDMTLRFQKGSGGESVLLTAEQIFATPPFAMPTEISVDAYEWLPDGSGEIWFEITFDSNPASLKIWAGKGGYESEDFLEITQPE